MSKNTAFENVPLDTMVSVQLTLRELELLVNRTQVLLEEAEIEHIELMRERIQLHQPSPVDERRAKRNVDILKERDMRFTNAILPYIEREAQACLASN